MTDPDLDQAAQRALERFDGDGLQLQFVIGKRSRWKAAMLPQREHVRDRLAANGWPADQITDDVIAIYEQEPIASGEGATKISAINDMQPVPWHRDVRKVLVKVIRPDWANDATDEERTFKAVVRHNFQTWTLPFSERLLEHCRDTGTAYYHATVKDGSLVLGSRIMDLTW